MRDVIPFVILVGLVGFAAPTSVVAQADVGPDEVEGGVSDAGSSCVQGVMETLSVLEPEVGAESLRQEAKAMCEGGAGVDVSMESIAEEMSEVVGEASDSDGEIDFLGQLLIGLLYIALALIPGGIVVWQMKRWSDTAEDWRDPSFEVDVSIDELRADPELVDEIRDKVQFVGLQRLPSSSSGGYGGASMQVRYAAFLVDANGETHDVVRSSDWAAVEADAEWLADELDVPVKDATYGG